MAKKKRYSTYKEAPKLKKKRYSHVVKAAKNTKLKLEQKFDGLFEHVATIKTGDVTIKNSELDFTFTVPFDDDPEANEAEIEIYNLSQSTIAKIKKGNKITITAGYEGDNGIIFSGYISSRKTKREGVDKITTICALDSEDRKEHKIKKISFKKGTKASYILKTLINKVGIPVAVFSVKKDKTYKDAVTVEGKLMENIKNYAIVCGVSVYINKGKLYCRSLKEGDNTKFTLSESTGLIDIEDYEEELSFDSVKQTVKGYKITMLMQHRMTTAGIVTVKSQNVSGKFRIRSGQHTYDTNDMLTEITVY